MGVSRRAGRPHAPPGRPAGPARPRAEAPRRPLCDLGPARTLSEPPAAMPTRGRPASALRWAPPGLCPRGPAEGRRRVACPPRTSPSLLHRPLGRLRGNIVPGDSGAAVSFAPLPGTGGCTRPAPAPPPAAGPRLSRAAATSLSPELSSASCDRGPGGHSGVGQGTPSGAARCRLSATGSHACVLTVGPTSSSWAPGHQGIPDRPLAHAEAPSGTEHKKP